MQTLESTVRNWIARDPDPAHRNRLETLLEENSPESLHTLERCFKGRYDISTEDRVRILRLIENMTLGRNAVGYLTESLHGAGSPQAQRIQILRNMDVAAKKRHARELAGIIASDADTG